MVGIIVAYLHTGEYQGTYLAIGDTRTIELARSPNQKSADFAISCPGFPRLSSALSGTRAPSTNPVTVGFNTLDDTATAGPDYTSATGTVIDGEAGADDIDGGGGEDSLEGGDGNDTIDGGGGNDFIQAGNGDGIFEESALQSALMIYDVSVPIQNGMPVWPSDPPVKLTGNSHLSRDKSHTIRVTSIEMGSHTGTHVDAPAHFVEGGKTLSEIPLEWFVGPATVFEIPAVRSIARGNLESLDWTGVERVLFKTDNSSHWQDGRFYEEFVYLEPEAGEFLVGKGVRVVGIDYLSIDQFRSPKHPTHFALLPHDVILIEGLNLSKISPGRYHMVALPLNLQDADGAPTRVILIDDK